MNIGLFGGSFDPIHTGHIALVQGMADALSLDRVILMPTGHPPHKLKKTDTTDEQWRQIFAANVDGMFYTIRAAVPHFVRRKAGHIVTLSSVWGVTGGSCEVVYSAAKGAVIAMTKALAKELGPSGVTVNCVAPGVVSTDMNAHLDVDSLEALRQEIPLERIGTPEDVARSIFFLANEESAYITGQVLQPNGGIFI